MIVFYIAL